LTEEDITVGTRQLGSWNGRMDISEKILDRQNLLLQRELDRIEQIIWALLSTGTFAVSQPGGSVIHTDIYNPQTYDGSSWADPDGGTPLADLRSAKLLARGHSVSFGASSKLYINAATANNILSNQNPADLGGRLSVSISGYRPLTNSLADVNTFLMGQDLPQFVIYDQGYPDDDGNWTLYIPNGKAILVGQRQGGAQIGSYRLVRNANNPDLAPGSYSKVVDTGEDKVPRTIEVHRGHNGGPTLTWPSALVIVNVA
jgi:hypothetical protein